MSDENVNKKYELTDETIEYNGRILHRIRALRDIGDRVSIGDLGGYVESEKNLSHDGNAWVCDNAWVYGNAMVYGNAWVYGKAWVCDNAMVYGNAWVCDNAVVCDNARVYGDARVYGNAWVCDNAEVFGDARVCDNARVYGKAWVCGNAMVYGNAWVCGNAMVCDKADYMVFKNTWSSGRWFTCFRDKGGVLMWSVGCFYGTGKELVAKAYEDSQLSGDCYKAAVEMAEKVFARTKQDSDSDKED